MSEPKDDGCRLTFLKCFYAWQDRPQSYRANDRPPNARLLPQPIQSLCASAVAMIDRSRLSVFGKPAAIPSSIHARLRLSPSRCASFGSLGSGDTTGWSHLAALDVEIWGMNVRSQRANAWLGSTRRIRSASPRHGDRKSSPEGSHASGPFWSLR